MSTPSRDRIAAAGKLSSEPPVLVASPSFYASQHLFGGRWGLPDSGLPLEKKQEDLLDFYIKEVEQRRWYGYWNYGDFMHTLDNVRGVWRYDVGQSALRPPPLQQSSQR